MYIVCCVLLWKPFTMAFKNLICSYSEQMVVSNGEKPYVIALCGKPLSVIERRTILPNGSKAECEMTKQELKMSAMKPRRIEQIN